jgi:hypothetical protein
VSGPVFLVCNDRPPAYKSVGKRHDAFRKRLEKVHKGQGTPRLDGLLYGIVYWFTFDYDLHRHPDADNISKGVWDSLGALGFYHDDKQVRLRVAGIYDLGSVRPGRTALEDFDLSALPLSVLSEFEAFLNQDPARPPQPYLTYIEAGPLRRDIFAFNLAEVGASR